MKRVRAFVVASIVAGALQGCASTGVTYREVAPKVIAPKEGSQTIQTMAVDGKNGMMVLVSRLYEDNGALALCAAVRVLAAEDLSPIVWEALNTDGSTLTVSPAKTAGAPFALKTAFIPVEFVHQGVNESITLMGDSNGKPAGCVVTNRPWRPELAQAGLKLNLLRKNVRAR